MKKIIIVRHGESTGNANNIIQGRKENYELTEKGKQNTNFKIRDNKDIFSKATKIVSSASKRTMETAEIISKELNLPIVIDKNIEEMDAGILSGMNKDIAKVKYPEYYKIWKERQDLDEIPLAESGEDLQARVIGFLMRYYDKEQFNDIIVTHAGFIRCLINTIENRERTFKFNIENSSVFQINNIFEKMDIETRERAMNSKVLVINTANGKYVVKIKKGKIREQDYAEQAFLNKLKGDNIPRILSMQKNNDDEFCKIIKYINGKHIYNKLSEEEYNALIESEELLARNLSKIGRTTFFKTKDLKSSLEKIYTNSKNVYIKTMAKQLIQNDKYGEIINNKEDYILSHDDLNRDNILFETKKDGKIRANIIDFESLEFAPKDFQFASMLASGLLLEGEDIEKIKQTIQEKGKDIEKILYLMQIRILEGLYFFAEKDNEYVLNNKKISRDLLKKYFFCSEILQKEIEKNKIKEGEMLEI